MSFHPFAPASDNRATRAATPLVLRNVSLEPNAKGFDARKPYLLAPTPGQKLRLKFNDDPLLTEGGDFLLREDEGRLVTEQGDGAARNVRALFCEPDVQGGALFAVAGSSLFSVSADWTATNLGTIDGAAQTMMRGFGSNLVIKGDARLYVYGTSQYITAENGDILEIETGGYLEVELATNQLVTIIDIDAPGAPSPPETLAVSAARVVSSSTGSDAFDWSSVANAEAWPAEGFASVQYASIKAIVESRGYLAIFGEKKMQFWRAAGGEDADAFDTVGFTPLDKGLLARDAVAQTDGGLMWIGDDRVAYQVDGAGSPVRIVNRDLEVALEGLTLPQAAQVRAFSYLDGSRLYFVVRPPVGATRVYDAAFDRWHERMTYNAGAYAVGHYARAYGKHVVASPDGPDLWTWEADAFDDAGRAIERVAAVHVPLPGPMAIDHITLDGQFFGQPVEGQQGTNPTIMLRFSRDGGMTWSDSRLGVIRTAPGPVAGNYQGNIRFSRFGRFVGQHGLLLEIRITDPIGFALFGVWVNEDPN